MLLAAALVVTGAGFYAASSLWRGNVGGGACRVSAAMAQGLLPLAVGEVAGMKIESDPIPLPDLAFDGSDGKRLTLASFKDKTVLLNLWATWCEPCKREMPALDKLQTAFEGRRFEVVAVNIDTRNFDRPKQWLADNGIRRLAYYADAKAQIFQDLRRLGEVDGLPTTILLGPDGCKLGKLSGWAEWASPEGIAMMTAALPRS